MVKSLKMRYSICSVPVLSFELKYVVNLFTSSCFSTILLSLSHIIER